MKKIILLTIMFSLSPAYLQAQDNSLQDAEQAKAKSDFFGSIEPMNLGLKKREQQQSQNQERLAKSVTDYATAAKNLDLLKDQTDNLVKYLNITKRQVFNSNIAEFERQIKLFNSILNSEDCKTKGGCPTIKSEVKRLNKAINILENKIENLTGE